MHTTLLRFAKALDATGNFDFIMFVGVIPRSYNYLCQTVTNWSVLTILRKLNGLKQLISKPNHILLVFNTDSKLIFNEHVGDICKKPNWKLRASAHTAHYMNLQKRKLVMNSFFNSQFDYCLLIWMLLSRYYNHKIQHLHERWLRLICNDKSSSYEVLLEHSNRNF